jgi:hypothetical protein
MTAQNAAAGLQMLVGSSKNSLTLTLPPSRPAATAGWATVGFALDVADGLGTVELIGHKVSGKDTPAQHSRIITVGFPELIDRFADGVRFGRMVGVLHLCLFPIVSGHPL